MCHDVGGLGYEDEFFAGEGEGELIDGFEVVEDFEVELHGEG